MCIYYFVVFIRYLLSAKLCVNPDVKNSQIGVGSCRDGSATFGSEILAGGPLDPNGIKIPPSSTSIVT